MRIRVMVKQIGKRKPIIGEQHLQLYQSTATLQELIEQIVTINVEQYNNRTVDELMVAALSEQEIQDKADHGKVGFNVRYNPNQQDLNKALENASLSFQDGLYKVFINDIEIEQWQQEISINEDDSILFLRLTMLAGRMW
ncbi:hypothetical protein [Cohnella sp.]|uniref:hypothetical protein n=1 Tax=Cohnella sp. TaxID=1883426 RepID=UPI0035686BF6